MDSSTVQLFGDKELKRKLLQSVSSVKKKIKALNEGKAELTSTLQETFQPITQPLNTLLHHINSNDDKGLIVKHETDEKSFQNKIKTAAGEVTHGKQEEYSNVDKEEYEDADESFDSLNKTIQSEMEEDSTLHPLARSYLDILVINNIKKVPYGIYVTPEGYYIGDSAVEFDTNHLIIKNQKFNYTPGLMELLFKREPNTSLIQPTDSDVYFKIITMTNAHRRNFSAEGQIQGDKSLKYTQYIKEVNHLSSSTPIQKSKTGGCFNRSGGTDNRIGLIDNRSGLLHEADNRIDDLLNARDQLVTGRGLSSSSTNNNYSNTDTTLLMKKYYPNTDIMYWDNPNELIDRLRLLIASRNAGNNDHDNEIIAILEELIEANIIESPRRLSNILKRILK